MGSGISNQITMPVWERSIILDSLLPELRLKTLLGRCFRNEPFTTNPATSENYQLHPSRIP